MLERKEKKNEVSEYSVYERECDDKKIGLKTFEQKGRGVIARQIISADEVISCCPVKVLSKQEYEFLRYIPYIRSYLMKNSMETESGIVSVKIGIDKLFDDVDGVLSSLQDVEIANSTIMYTFSWPRPLEAGGDTAAIAFGLVSMCNHSGKESSANAKIVRDFEDEAIALIATTVIEMGDEILIEYSSVPFNCA